MLYTKEFIAGIKAQPASALARACVMAFERLEATTNWDEEAYRVLGEAYALVSSVIEAGLVNMDGISTPTLRGRVHEDCMAINQYLLAVRKECQVLVQLERIELLKTRSRHGLGITPPPAQEPGYRFEAGEISRLRELLAQIKHLLGQCTQLDPRMQARVSRRLVDIEADLRESMTEWDRFWGLLGEARVFLGQCGDSARHFARTFTEMSQIVGAAQGRAAGLPTGHGLARLTLDHYAAIGD